MALTESNKVEIGSLAPNFSLPNTIDNITYSLQELQGKQGTVIAFICNHCPFVKHINKELVQLANEYQNKGIHFIAISSNDVANYPEDSPENMKLMAEELNYPFPYLYDESQQVAKAYDAACTPDFYVVDSNLQFTYHGRFDASRPGNSIPVTGNDLQLAMDALLTGNKPIQNQFPSIGCNIKWKED